MSKCRKCKKKIPDHLMYITPEGKITEYCMSCQLKIWEQPVPGEKKCISCNAIIPKRNRYCTDCARQVQLDAQREWREKNGEEYRKDHYQMFKDHYKEAARNAYQRLKDDPVRWEAARKRDAEAKRHKRFNNPIRFCFTCKKHLKKENFTVMATGKWSKTCNTCYGAK